MVPWYRTCVAGLIVAFFPSLVFGQIGSGDSYSNGFVFGQGLGGQQIPIASMPYGLAGSGFYLSPNPYVPNQLAGFNPFRNPDLNPQGMRRLSGPEGPGGLKLSAPANARPASSTTPARQNNSTRADELLELGDRAFRGGNYKRSAERYRLASKSNPDSPLPHVHLAQIAIFHGEYSAAADHLRDATASTPDSGWLRNAPDVQSMYGEPADFARQVAKLESFLQTHPDDRNAWFVLGAQNFFSGHPQLAADAFMRLSDRRADPALSAFLTASSVAVDRSRQTQSDVFR